jgi:hypothetical protein
MSIKLVLIHFGFYQTKHKACKVMAAFFYWRIGLSEIVRGPFLNLDFGPESICTLTVRISTERLIALFGKYLKYMLYQKTDGQSRERRKPFCAYAML